MEMEIDGDEDMEMEMVQCNPGSPAKALMAPGVSTRVPVSIMCVGQPDPKAKASSEIPQELCRHLGEHRQKGNKQRRADSEHWSMKDGSFG